MHRMRVASGIRSPRWWTPALLAAAIIAVPAHADVEVKQQTVSEGLAGFGESTTTSTLTVTRDRSRSEDEYKYTGRMKTFMGGKQKSVSITRLDQEVIWSLDPKKKEYTELTFQQMRDMLSGKTGPMGMPGMSGMPEDEEQAPDVEMECHIETDAPGGTQEVNGFTCHNVIVTINCEAKGADVEEGLPPGATPGRIVYDLWITKDAPGFDEMQAYHKAFAEKLGLGVQMAGASGMARRVLGEAMKDLQGTLANLDGFPVRSTFTMERAPMTDEQKKAMEEAMAEADAAQTKAEKDAAKDAAASTASGDPKSGMSGFLGKKLGGMFGRKAREQAMDSQDKPLFRVTTEVVSIKNKKASSEAFEIPAGYEKKQSSE